MTNRYETLTADQQRKARVLFPLFARCVEANYSSSAQGCVVDWYDAAASFKVSAGEEIARDVIDALIDMACDHPTLYTGLHPENAECFRNVYKSVHGFNPRTYPMTDAEFLQEIEELDRLREEQQQWEEIQKRREAEAWEAAFAPHPPHTPFAQLLETVK